MQELPKQFDPKPIEKKWYDYWEKHNYFHSEPDEREPYTIVIPPPNVTGVLHMGHVLNNTLQDVLVRHARLIGKNACWVPGTDHASIATEAKVVNKLRQQGIKKSDLSRDEFMDKAWEWTDEHGGIILKQLKSLGASCDWDRTRFTLEDDLYEAVIDCFIDLYEKGLIYRSKRMVNWDPEAKTSLSDEEVIHKEEQSKFYHIRYKLENDDGFVTIATTRPETILADTAIGVNPDDTRYQHLIGKKAIVPLENRSIPIIADSYVDIEFGTGCLKVTPAHDENDYELGIKHHLDIIDMFNADATVSDRVNFYVGKDRFEARKLIIKDLEDKGHLVDIVSITNKLGYSERTNAIIEPRLSLQWFLKMDEISKPALEHVLNDTIKFHPSKFKNSYRHWMENVKDWCISRQLWWGQRIPAWYFGEGRDEYVIAKTETVALQKAIEKSGRNIDLIELKQDEDVLDTWFSSWLWPITVFDGFKNPEGKDINYYYPTNDLVTAPEIMFFWVARMIIAGYEYRGTEPFKNVYYTGIVRDQKRRKMSKSLGNSPDPLDLIAKYGADGVRVGMLFSAPAGNDLLFDEKLCEQGRNFANKIWNAFRFLSMNMKDGETYKIDLASSKLSLSDSWMLTRIKSTIEQMNSDFENFRINEALKGIYSLLWDDFCDWYIEVCKSSIPGQPIEKEQLAKALALFEYLLTLLHPFMPFITEEIWQTMWVRTPDEALIIGKWPHVAENLTSKKNEVIFNVTKKLISAIRNIRAEMNISPKISLTIFIITPGEREARDLEEARFVFEKLESINELKIADELDKPAFSASSVVDGYELYIPLEGIIDIEVEKERITKEISRLEEFLTGIERKLSNEKFVQNAPDDVVANERKKASDTIETLGKLKKNLSDLS